MKTKRHVIAVVISSALCFQLGMLWNNLPSKVVHAARLQQPVSQSTETKPCPQQTQSSITSIKSVKRVYIENASVDAASSQILSMLVTELMNTHRFIVTENREKADAIIKGSALEQVSQEEHSFNTGTAAGHSSGGHSSTISGSGGSISGSSSGGYNSVAAAINDSYHSTETIHDARISVRLVNQDGDVLWATTQESKGAKYKGASADVAEKVAKQLVYDIDKLEGKPE